MTFRPLLKAFAATLLAALSFSAFAHVGVDAGTHHGFLAGFLHPLSGLDHLAAMLAVGVWSALATRRIWAAPLSFALTLFVGALLAQAGVGFPGVEPMIVVSMLVIGLLLATRIQLPVVAGAALVGGFALFHGAAHGQELVGTTALLGMVASTALLHGIGLGLGIAIRRQSIWLPRASGALVAALGLGMGWSLLAG